MGCVCVCVRPDSAGCPFVSAGSVITVDCYRTDWSAASGSVREMAQRSKWVGCIPAPVRSSHSKESGKCMVTVAGEQLEDCEP